MRSRDVDRQLSWHDSEIPIARYQSFSLVASLSLLSRLFAVKEYLWDHFMFKQRLDSNNKTCVELLHQQTGGWQVYPLDKSFPASEEIALDQ